ncbi:MAG: hypothetical protein MRY83_00045, partial [Flavobacteriales bacterium]|nr:hypothetical protein [Flavobacteriales bacterium]
MTKFYLILSIPLVFVYHQVLSLSNTYQKAEIYFHEFKDSLALEAIQSVMDCKGQGLQNCYEGHLNL